MTAEARNQRCAPESPTDLLELLRDELAHEPLPGTTGYWPVSDQPGTGSVRLVPGTLTDDGVVAVLSGTTPDGGDLRLTVAIRDVDGLAPGWYEFRDGSCRAIDDLGEPDGDHPATVYLCGRGDAVLGDGVHAWRRVLLAAGAARAVVESRARAFGYALRPVPASSAPGSGGRDFLVQAWGFGPASVDGT
ncbi:hypothetical protein [Allokutzneria oryzae]|uniref:Uncharacterized protein n=1 Tax=Allokutzneria oryzae TaxID=1378989 RepID=A0ABV5ZS25_9PSEU